MFALCPPCGEEEEEESLYNEAVAARGRHHPEEGPTVNYDQDDQDQGRRLDGGLMAVEKKRNR
jgi:hypothetical protein